jgi:hypothetical protein
VESKSRI